jgi:DNA-binding HxlR family transcriptional regulator
VDMSASVLSRQLSRLRTLGLIKKVAHTFYEQKVVKAFRELGSRIIGQLPSAPPVREARIGSRAGQSLAPADP